MKQKVTFVRYLDNNNKISHPPHPKSQIMKDLFNLIISVIGLLNLFPSDSNKIVIEKGNLNTYFNQVGIHLKNGISKYESQTR